MSNLDKILSNLCESVKEKNNYISEAAQSTDWEAIQTEQEKNRQAKADPTVATPVLKAYTSILEREKLNNLRDSFRTEENQTVEYSTEGSFKKALARFNFQLYTVTAYC